MQTTPVAKAEQVAAFLVSMVFHYLDSGICKFTFWLDNARTHKKKMKGCFREYLEYFGIENQIQVEFVHIPPYSPQMNAAEYFIQLIRKAYLKNLPPDQSMEQVLNRLLPKVEGKQLLNPSQMKNIIARIKRIHAI